MARPERNEVDYFPFYCKEGKVMFILEKKYGNDGYATWVKILRLLAITNFHYLDLSSDFDVEYLATKCGVTNTVLIEIIEILVLSEELDKELWEKKRVIWNQKFVDSIQDAYGRRNNKCIDRNSLILRLGLSLQTDNKPNDPPPDEPIEKFDFKKALLNYGFDNRLVSEWLKVRKVKKAVNTETSFKGFISEVKKANKNINVILQLCVERSWSGFKNEWLINQNTNQNGNQKRNQDSILEAQRDRIMSEINVSIVGENATNEGHGFKDLDGAKTE